MNVDLQGRLVLVQGASGVLRDAIEAALRDNGAVLADIGEAIEFYGLVNISQGACALSQAPNAADELPRFAAAIRAHAGSLKSAVTVMSSAALVPVRGFAEFSAAEAGLERMTRALAMDLGPHTRVNGVAVGAIEQATTGTERLVSHTATRRAGSLEAVVSAVLFLLDPDNSYMTGHTLAVDGGWHIGYARNF